MTAGMDLCPGLIPERTVAWKEKIPSPATASPCVPSSKSCSAAQQLFDDGTHGDAVAGDGIFSFQATVLSGISPGHKSIPAVITDAQARSGGASISLTVTASTTPPIDR